MKNLTNDRMAAGDGEQNKDEEASLEQNENDEPDSVKDDYQRDESNRGERPDNLRRRSEWFQKRTGR